MNGQLLVNDWNTWLARDNTSVTLNFTAEELAYILVNSEAQLLITSQARREVARAVGRSSAEGPQLIDEIPPSEMVGAEQGEQQTLL